MSTGPDHSAAHSAAGYSFQLLYGLIVLLESADEAAVSLETRDDIELHGELPTLFQLKHSIDPTGSVSIKDDGFWKTLGIWIPLISEPRLQFCFVTSTRISSTSELVCLRDGLPVDKLRAVLMSEAVRVNEKVATAERDRETTGSESRPYKVRGPACSAFADLSEDEQSHLLGRIRIRELSFNLANISSAIAEMLVQYPRKNRARIAEGLVEWWQQRANMALSDKSTNRITRDEVLSKLSELSKEIEVGVLPNDFEFQKPADDLDCSRMNFVRQIELVHGGTARTNLAVLAHWRARSQRARWVSEDMSVLLELKNFDRRLEQYWNERFAPMSEDMVGKPPHEQEQRGLEIFRDCFEDAASRTAPPRASWTAPFVAQGTMQQLADDCTVGWHPRFRELMGDSKETATEIPKGSKVGKSSSKTRKATRGSK